MVNSVIITFGGVVMAGVTVTFTVLAVLPISLMADSVYVVVQRVKPALYHLN